MEIKLSNVNEEYNLCMETSKKEHVELSTWGFSAGDHHVSVIFFTVKPEEVFHAFAKAFASELAEVIQDALAHFANHCPYCDRDLEFYITPEEAREWLSQELVPETARKDV
mgnify:CR=1 FL=1